MTLRNLLARLSGKTQALSPEEVELRRLSAAGDNARRERQPEIALGYYQQGLELARRQLSLPGEEVFLGLIGTLQTERGRYEEAETALQEAIEITERIGEMARRARAIGNLGAHYLVRGLIIKAQNVLEQALELARLSADANVIGLVLANMGSVYLKQDNTAYALRLLKEAVALLQAQPASESANAAYAIGLLGQAHLNAGESDRGYRLLTQAIRLAQQNGNLEQELTWSNALAESLFKNNSLPEALKLYERCDELAAQVTRLPTEYAQRHLLNRAAVHERSGQHEMALGYVNRALEQARTEADRSAEAQALSLLGEIYRSLGDLVQAAQSLETAAGLYTGGTLKNTDAHINTLLTLGGLYQLNGDAPHALQTFDEALKLTEGEGGGPAARARALRRIGNVFQEQNDLPHALERWTESLDLLERTGQYAAAARLLCDVGMARRLIGGINQALPEYEHATMLLSSVTDPATRGLVLSNVANLYTDLGEVETAASFYQEAIQLARQAADRRSESLRSGNYGWFYVATGQPTQAVKLLEEALALSRPLGDPLLIAVQTSNLGQAYHALKDYKTAQGLFEQSLAAAERLAQPRWQATFRSNLGKTFAAQGRLDEAMALYEQALPVSRQANDQENVSRTLARMADIYLRREQFEQADSAAREAEMMARRWGYRKGQADSLVVRAGVARAQGDSAEADRFLTEAIKLYTILHDPLATELAPQKAAEPGS